MPPRKGKKATQARGVPSSDLNTHTKNHNSSNLVDLFPSLKDTGRIFITLPPMQAISSPSSPNKSTETHTEQQPESPLSNFFPELRQDKDTTNLNMVYKLPPLPGFSPPSSPLNPSEKSVQDNNAMDVDAPQEHYHLNPASDEHTLWERRALLFANPTLWSPIPDDLPLLAPKGWLESSLIDWYILNQNASSDIQTKMTFIPCQIIADLIFYIQSHPEAHTVPEEIKAKWESLIPPQQQTFLLQHPQITTHAVFGVQQANHWFTVIFDHTFQSVYVFNHIFLNSRQEKKTRDNWSVWKGPQLWTLVADLMNWNVGPSPDNIRALSWFGNGSDCGVELTEILIDLILNTGMRIDERGIWPLKPHLSCSHVFQEQMLYQILPSVKEAYLFWKANYNQNIPEVTNWNNDIVMDQTKHHFESVKQKIIRIDPDFDDYNTGPTIQETMGVPHHIKNFPIFNRTQLDPLSIWSLWTDYGYQIDNNFAETFISQSPEHPEEHYLPINHQSGEHILPESLKRWDLTRRNQTREAISDICFLDMQELLELAGDPRSGNGLDLFIRGIRYDPEDCEKEEMVHLDITRDAVPTENVPVYISVDIDSLIWKTHRLHLKASINIHMAPYMQPKPPINIHNRTYVNLLKPQTDIQ
ncbi:hypothetical protein M422DRAFT_270490 [Sphaerobolus stellatus SS14]|uniref:Uncharacterized protein n=1 Tax=Sphaerobolus stellatus (strain SS14) TaxID=990650 RepID=A0A0C9USP7_SPHS4|nr:hypothetical protein M422DRAFT_270490 [Sphaerobolus stellatus SS14]